MKKLIEWVEIPAANFKRAVKFYNAVFNLSMEEMDCGTEKMACFPTGEGGIFFKESDKPSENGTIIHLSVPDNIEQASIRVQENGGKMVLPKTKIEAEGRGFFALCLDSEGNKIGLYEKP